MAVAATMVPAPEFGPITRVKMLLGEIGPGDEVPAVVGRQVDTIRLMVRSDDDAEAVRHAVFAEVLLVYAQDIRRGSGISLHVVVELKSIEVAEIARLIDAENDGFHKTVKPAQHVMRRYFAEIPRPYRPFHRFEQGIFPDALSAAKDEGVIQLFLRSLNAMCKPPHNVLCVLTVDAMDMFNPLLGLVWISLDA
jgi:hypothetical protein